MKDNYDTTYQKHWRPLGAAVYFFLVIFDYFLRPLINTKNLDKFDLSTTVESIKNLDPSIQIKLVEIAEESTKISPILPEYVHYTFAAILGASAWTRGKEKIERLSTKEKKVDNEHTSY